MRKQVEHHLVPIQDTRGLTLMPSTGKLLNYLLICGVTIWRNVSQSVSQKVRPRDSYGAKKQFNLLPNQLKAGLTMIEIDFTAWEWDDIIENIVFENWVLSKLSF